MLTQAQLREDVFTGKITLEQYLVAQGAGRKPKLTAAQKKSKIDTANERAIKGYWMRNMGEYPMNQYVRLYDKLQENGKKPEEAVALVKKSIEEHEVHILLS